MNTQIDGLETKTTGHPFGHDPDWWTDRHATRWEKVKQAFRRDWEQTKEDLSRGSGVALKQTAADTIAQATSADAPLPLTVRMRRLDARDAANAANRALAESVRAREAIQHAARAMADASAKLARTIADADDDRRAAEWTEADTIASADRAVANRTQAAYVKAEQVSRALADAPKAERLEAIVATSIEGSRAIADATAKAQKNVEHAHDALASRALEIDDRVASAHEDASAAMARDRRAVDEAVAARDAAIGEWREAEQEARYGFSARAQYPAAQDWTPAVSIALATEWESLGTGRAWRVAVIGVRRGWDFPDDGA